MGDDDYFVKFLHAQREEELREIIGRAYEVKHNIYVPVEKKKWYKHPLLALREKYLRKKWKA